MGAELNKALAAFQSDIPTVPKAAPVDSGSFKFDYAPLEDITDKAMPLLGKHGLSYSCLPGTDDQGRLVLDYALLHESGEERGGQFPLWLVLPEKFKAQTIGGLITFFRRYCLCAVTGIAPGGEDDDAASSAEVHMDRARPQSRPPGDVPTTATPIRARTTGREHEQLRHGTVEATPDDRPAERAKRPAQDDEWTDQPATVNPVVKARCKAIIMRLGELEVADREERLGITAKLAGWPEGKTLNSTNDLSREQSVRVMAQLSDLTDHEALMALVTKGEKQDA